MQDGRDVGVVEVKHVRGDAVDQRGGHRIDFLAAPGQAARTGVTQPCSGSQRPIGGGVARAGNRNGQDVQDGPFRLVDYIRRQVCLVQLDDPRREIGCCPHVTSNVNPGAFVFR